MSELKHKMATRSCKQTVPQSNHSSAQKQQQKPKMKPTSNGQKRPLQQQSLTSMFRKKETQIVPEPIEILYSVKQILKNTTLADIMENCPKIKSFYQLLCSQRCISQKLVFSCLDKYFHGNTTSLWAQKYGPRNVNQLFQPDFAEKIQQWIKDFYYFRKTDDPFGSDLQFIDDQPQQSYSKSLQMRMVENGWNCKALILRGRSGVGKTSFINAIAKSMRIRCFQYASDVDQLQKMKQMCDGSQSQVVNNYQVKKKQQLNNKLIRENSSITKYIPPNQKKQDLETKQPRRMQIFRNFSYYFAPYDKTDKQAAEDSYFRHLFQSINKSVIPYVLTTDKQEFSFREKSSNESYSKLDQIQFIENTSEDLTYLYWTIYQIQYNLRLNNTKKIKKDSLYNEINQQFKDNQFVCLDIFQLIRQLVIASNKKPLYIAKYLQFKVFARQKYAENGGLSCQKCLESAIDKIGHEIVDKINSDSLISNVQWGLYTKICDDMNPLEQTAAQQLQKSEKSERSQKSEKKQQKQYPQKKPNLRQIRQMIELQTIKDNKVFKNEYYHFNNFEQRSGDCFGDIPIENHIRAKKTLLKNIKTRIFSNMEQKEKKRPYYNLRQQQMYYLPMLFPSKRTSSRTLRKQNRECRQQNLSKIMTEKELSYMGKFAKFVPI